MTDEIKEFYDRTGGPAHPINPDTAASYKGMPYEQFMGMSLRDWFAGQALIGLLSSPSVPRYKGEVVESEAHYAAMAYAAADAMLKQRGES